MAFYIYTSVLLSFQYNSIQIIIKYIVNFIAIKIIEMFTNWLKSIATCIQFHWSSSSCLTSSYQLIICDANEYKLTSHVSLHLQVCISIPLSVFSFSHFSTLHVYLNFQHIWSEHEQHLECCTILCVELLLNQVDQQQQNILSLEFHCGSFFFL